MLMFLQFLKVTQLLMQYYFSTNPSRCLLCLHSHINRDYLL